MNVKNAWMVLILAVPRIVGAADLGPFVELGPVGKGLTGLAYIFGAAGIVWCACHAVGAYRAREMEGMGAVWGWIVATVVGAILVGTIVPKFVDPIVALGATL